jgi:hypothetical protein
MHRLSILAAAVALAVALPDAAQAMTCYTVLDRSDTPIYQDTQPPFDLSSEAAATARDMLRSHHEFLTISETDRCPQVSAPVASGGQPASVEDIVAGIRPYGAGAVGSSAGSRGAAARSTTAPAAARSSSSGMRKY